ncbi:MAG: tRNA guanosine(34) transglycosylase Tgt [Candidatus Shapirobacteria bacterium]
MRPTHFKTITGQSIPLPVFFPDATRAVLKALDSADIVGTKTPGILVNTFHLFSQPGLSVIKQFKGVRPFMDWGGGVISDSGGFQVMSLAKADGNKNAVTDKGVTFKTQNLGKVFFTPEMSINMQFAIKSDMIVALDDFTPPNASPAESRETVERTILWAKVCKKIFTKTCQERKIDPENQPYLLGVVQGGDDLKLRTECTERLVDIGFDGLGYGGWPLNEDGFNYDVAKTIAKNSPNNYLLYGLGVGKPDEIAGCARLGWQIFDCVLPTRDARHRRLYVYNADNIDHIDINQSKFYSYYTPDKEIHYRSQKPVSTACDCHLCTHYSRAYLGHLFRIGDMTAGRLATIHNLRFYSILMDKIREQVNPNS